MRKEKDKKIKKIYIFCKITNHETTHHHTASTRHLVVGDPIHPKRGGGIDLVSTTTNSYWCLRVCVVRPPPIDAVIPADRK